MGPSPSGTFYRVRRASGRGGVHRAAGPAKKEEREMRVKVAVLLALAAVAWAGLPGTARAGHCGACRYPAQAACPEQCAMPAVSYRVCYRTVVEDQTQV